MQRDHGLEQQFEPPVVDRLAQRCGLAACLLDETGKTGGKPAGFQGGVAARGKPGQGEAQRPGSLCRLQAGSRQANRLAADRNCMTFGPGLDQCFEARGEPGDVELPLAQHAVAAGGDLADDGTGTRHATERFADGIA